MLFWGQVWACLLPGGQGADMGEGILRCASGSVSGVCAGGSGGACSREPDASSDNSSWKLPGIGHLDDLADCDRLAIGLQRGAVRRALNLCRCEIDLARAILAAVGLVRDHALREQRSEGFLHLQLAAMGQRTGPEAGVEQVQDRVLDAADVLVVPLFTTNEVNETS